MTGDAKKKGLPTMTNYRQLSVVVFSLFFSWLLAFPFEGRILYSLADLYNVPARSFVFGTMAAHFAGLLSCGFFIAAFLVGCCVAA